MSSKPLSIRDVDVEGKSVIVRADLEGEYDSPRFIATMELVNNLKSRHAERVKVIGHDGSIGMVEKLETDVNWDLRSDAREKEDSQEFAQELASGFDIYVNESFAVSHRKHTSIHALPLYMKSQGKTVCMGIRFEKELDMLSSIDMDQGGNRVLVVGGIKIEDKTGYAQNFADRGWEVLRGGLLPGAELRPDGLDISDASIDRYKKIIAQAKTIIAAGVMGKFEDDNSSRGTREILTAITTSSAHKIAGGGDIEKAISKYGLSHKFDWISVGGGAMLEFLTNGNLSGIIALN